MNKQIQFFMHMKKVPTTTHQQKKVGVINGKPQHYEPDSVKKARALFMGQLAPHVPAEMIVGQPVRLTTWWLFGTSDKKKQGKLKLTRPDTDNSIKLLKDCMSELKFWKDDALVAIDEIHKYWADEDKAGILVRIEVMEQ